MGQQQQHQQNTVPRSMANKRSFSTSAAQGQSIGQRGIPHMKSEGNIHDPDSIEDYTMPPHPEEGEIDNSVYTDPIPDPNAFRQQGPEANGGRHLSLERGRQPGYPVGGPHHHQPLPPQSYANQQQQHHAHHQQRSRHPGMINGALAASADQFSSFGIVGEGPVPPAMQNYPIPGSAQERDLKRESLFSETSTELSISSNGDAPQQQQQQRGGGGAIMMRGGSKLGSLHTDISDPSGSNSDKEFSPGNSVSNLDTLDSLDKAHYGR